MVERLAARARRFDEDAQIGAQLRLADEVVEGERAERRLAGIVAARFRRHHALLAHRLSSCKPTRMSASIFAASPRRLAACVTAPNASLRE